MTEAGFEAILVKEGIPYETQVSLKKKTWIHRGGIAELFVTPRNVVELERAMSLLYANNIKHLVVGSTSNIYILNTTNIPVVVSTLKCNSFRIENSILECDCGMQVAKLARQMISQGIKGFEFLTKLPGTIGAAICNNSSVKSENNSITSLLIDVDMVTPSGMQRLRKGDLHLAFRTSDIKRKLRQGVILRARLKVECGNVAEMEAIAQRNESERVLLLEGPANNLGCTVHQMFCNGAMPLKYSRPLKVYSKILSLFVKDSIIKKKYQKSFLLTITGHRHLKPYVSDKQLITFIWRDDDADEYFDEYLCFMREVCMTDRIEIEIIR